MKKLLKITLIILLVLLSLSCKKESLTEPEKSIKFDTKDFYPNYGNDHVLTYRYSYEYTKYDSLGRVVERTIENNVAAKIKWGYNKIISGSIFQEIMFLDKNNRFSLVGYLGFVPNTGYLGYAPEKRDYGYDYILILPDELFVGKEWMIKYNNNGIGRIIKYKIIKFFDKYSNSAGRNFDNVFQIDILHDFIYDTTYSWSYYNYFGIEYLSEKTNSKVSVYFAKNIGPVEIKLIDFNSIVYSVIYETYYDYWYGWRTYEDRNYRKIVCKGSINLP